MNKSRSLEEILVDRKLDRKLTSTKLSALNNRPNVYHHGINDKTNLTTAGSLPDIYNTNGNRLSTSRNSSNTGLEETSDSVKDSIMDSLMIYCRSLQSKVEQLESKLSSVNGNSIRSSQNFELNNQVINSQLANSFQVQSATQTNLSQSGTKPSAVKVGTLQKQPSSHFHIQHNYGAACGVSELLSGIDSKITNLKELFRGIDPIEERKNAATRIASMVRCWLARLRLINYWQGLRAWKWSKCRYVIRILDILLANTSKLDAGFHLLKMNRNMKILHSVYTKWANVVRQNAPIRKEIRIKSEEKILGKKMQLIRTVFNGLKAASVGEFSLKTANAERRKLIETIRLELSNKLRRQGRIGVVPEDEIKKFMKRRVVEKFMEKKQLLLQQQIFNMFNAIRLAAKKNVVVADYQRFRTLAGRCFYSWSDYTYLVAVGIDRKRWIGPRKFEVRYNQKRVDNFTRLRCQRFIFLAWKALFLIQYRVKRMYQSKVAVLVKGVFNAWKDVSGHQHRLRLLVFENWKGYIRMLMFYPFNAWANQIKAIRNHHNEQLRIAKSYLRWKWRQKMTRIVKVWRHQALYGRIDGLYTRQMLLKTLAEQKQYANTMEKTMSGQTVELEDCKNMVSVEISKRQDLEAQLVDQQANNSKMMMKNHHYEQEIRKLESVIQSMVVINPQQVNYIKKMHPKFRFRDRHIVLPRLSDNGMGFEEEEDGSQVNEESVERKDQGTVRKNSSKSDPFALGSPKDKASLDIMSMKRNQPSDSDMDVSTNGEGDHHSILSSASNSYLGLTVMAEGDQEDEDDHTEGDQVQNEEAKMNSSLPSIREVDIQISEATSHNIPKPLDLSEKVTVGANLNDDPVREMDWTEGDRLLLKRVKWFLEKYRDVHRRELAAEHQMHSINLVVTKGGAYLNQFAPSASNGTKVNSSVLSEANGQGMIGMNGTSTEQEDNAPMKSLADMDREDLNSLEWFEYDDHGKIKLQSRPPLLSVDPAVTVIQETQPTSTERNRSSFVDILYKDEVARSCFSAAKILMALVDFLDFGSDRRSWTLGLLNIPDKDELEESKAAAEEHVMTNQTDKLHESSQVESNSSPKLVTLDQTMPGTYSWRDTLLKLRTLYPEAGNQSGMVGYVLNKEDEEIGGMFKRIIQMRSHLNKIMGAEIEKSQRKFFNQPLTKQMDMDGLQIKMDTDIHFPSSDNQMGSKPFGLEDALSAAKNLSLRLGQPSNIYSQNLKNFGIISETASVDESTNVALNPSNGFEEPL